MTRVRDLEIKNIQKRIESIETEIDKINKRLDTLEWLIQKLCSVEKDSGTNVSGKKSTTKE